MGLHPAHHHRHLCATMDKLLLHGYCLGTAAWYTLRGGCRIWDPAMVVGWFRPPAQRHLEPNDLELYNVRTDAWGLLSLAGVMVTISQAVPYPRLFASWTSKSASKTTKRRRMTRPRRSSSSPLPSATPSSSSASSTTSPPASGLSSTTSVTPTTTPRWASVSGRMPSSPSSGLPPSLQETEGSRRGERPGKVGLSGSKRELDEKRVCRSCAP